MVPGGVCWSGKVAKLLAHRIAKSQRFTLQDRDKVVKIPQEILSLLPVWTSPNFLSRPELVRPAPPSVTIWTDACLTGWGAFSSLNQMWSGTWPKEMQGLHINLLELETVFQVIRRSSFSQISLQIVTDNVATAAVISNFGSKSRRLQELAERLFALLKRLHLHLSVSHISGHLNVVADALSREEPVPTEWQVDQKEFLRLEGLHGSTLEVDLFASPLNFKRKPFVATFNHPDALAVDAMSQDWNTWNEIYLFPPVNFLKKVVLKLRTFRGGGLIIAPRLPNAIWYPYLSERCRALVLKQNPFQIIYRKKVSIACKLSVPWIAYSFSKGYMLTNTQNL